MTSTSRANRFRGCLIGLAVGDAVGTTLEFCRPGTFAPISDMIGGGLFDLKPGEWTDDTSMALCLATSLVEQHGFDAHDQMQRYLQWYQTGYLSSNGQCFDIGNTVRIALTRFRETGKAFSGSTDPGTAGNGSIMRLAPVPMFFANDAEKAVHFSGESSRTTHAAPSAVDACRYFGGLIFGALHGATKESLLSPNYSPATEYWKRNLLNPDIAVIAEGSFKRKGPPGIRGTGYVVQSLEAALWAFFKSSSFPEGLLLAVNLGDDADTTGAVYGQLAGAFYGESAIPQSWRLKLAKRDIIESLADDLMAQAFEQK